MTPTDEQIQHCNCQVRHRELVRKTRRRMTYEVTGGGLACLPACVRATPAQYVEGIRYEIDNPICVGPRPINLPLGDGGGSWRYVHILRVRRSWVGR